MVDDGLIAGAAAPAGTRRIRSVSTLDAVWVAVVAVLLFGSSFFWLIDLPTASLRTLDAPLRVYVVVVPTVALVISVVALIRHSETLAAVATGVLVPGISLAGSLAGSLFFDAASPFTDAGVPLTLGVAVIGVVMLLRWFVYRPDVIVDVEARPPMISAQALVLLGAVLIANVVVGAVLDDPEWSLSFLVSTGFMSVGPIVVVAAGALRSVNGHVLAAAVCCAQPLAVLSAVIDDGDVTIGSAFALRTGVVGLVGLVAAAGMAIAGAVTADVEPAQDVARSIDDDTSWRWSSDDG